jgi:cytochrome c peroxidase
LAQRDSLPSLPVSGQSELNSSQHRVNVPLGLPEVPIPNYNPITREKIALGKQLFFDRRLSESGSISCASCHNPEKGFSDGVALSRGTGGLKGQRNTPTLINVAFQPYQFWDGRATSLEDQSLGPLHNPQEMGQSSEPAVTRLNRIPYYRERFREVFKSSITNETIAQALASYERTLLSGNSSYDQFTTGDRAALNQQALYGLQLFNGKAHCSLCHQGFNFSDGLFHNLGVGWDGKEFQDPGRFKVTGIFRDRGAFKTPTLRQVSDTAPYMHDGSLANLEAVVDFYARGGNPNPHLDILIQPLQLTLAEKKALLAFLKALSPGP